MEAQEQGAARELIRDVDSRTVFVHPDPDSLEKPWAYEGFGIYRGTLFGAYRELEELASALDLEWAMKTAVARREEESARVPTVWEWITIWDEKDLEGALFVAVNPRLARYSPETGFQLGLAGDPDWQSPPRDPRSKGTSFAPYERETFQEHVERMMAVYDYPFYDRREDRECLPLREELTYAARRLEEAYGWPSGTLNSLARLVITLHDVGKLDRAWQAWAHRWQEEVGTLRGKEMTIPDDYMAAHTDYNGQDDEEKALNRKLRRLRPKHAAESAQAVEDLVWELTRRQELLRAAMTVIARHHSAGARGNYGSFRAHPAAAATLDEMIPDLNGEHVAWSFSEGSMARRLVRPTRHKEVLPYLLLARVLRLADQRSQMGRSS